MPRGTNPDFTLRDGSRVAVVGGGPAGSLFASFLLDHAHRRGLAVSVEIFEPRDFHEPGPAGCNMCGGILSETLLDHLAREGIQLPDDVLHHSISGYVLHTETGGVRIETPSHDSHIGVSNRGGGPPGLKDLTWGSLDRHLFDLAEAKGAIGRRDRVIRFERTLGRPVIHTRDGAEGDYDLLAIAVGVNSTALKLLPRLEPGYKPPRVSRSATREYLLGADVVKRALGDTMHVFLLDMDGVEFAAVIPKGDVATLCLLGANIDEAMMRGFCDRAEVRALMPEGWRPDAVSCHCQPRVNVGTAARPFADRVVFIGDCATSRLYKDGIGAAYWTASAAADTAAHHGVSADAFAKHYWPTCRDLDRDNRFGRMSFAVAGVIQRSRLLRAALMRMVEAEQGGPRTGRLSRMLWDMFTGGAPYRSIFLRGLHPAFLGRFLWAVAREWTARPAVRVDPGHHPVIT